jgi:hypothetical protein
MPTLVFFFSFFVCIFCWLFVLLCYFVSLLRWGLGDSFLGGGQGWSLTVILLISVSRVAGITGVSQHFWPLSSHFTDGETEVQSTQLVNGQVDSTGRVSLLEVEKCACLPGWLLFQ